MLRALKEHRDLLIDDITWRPLVAPSGNDPHVLDLPGLDRRFCFPSAAEGTTGLSQHWRACDHTGVPRMVRCDRHHRYALRPHVRGLPDGLVLQDAYRGGHHISHYRLYRIRSALHILPRGILLPGRDVGTRHDVHGLGE